LFEYIEISFTVVQLSHSDEILSKLYIAINPESYRLYVVQFRLRSSSQIFASVISICPVNVAPDSRTLFAGVTHVKAMVGAIVSIPFTVTVIFFVGVSPSANVRIHVSVPVFHMVGI